MSSLCHSNFPHFHEIIFNMIYDYIVIGAGAAGLSFTALMEKKGFRVALLEAHSLPGGCSSYFERNGNVFDVGATTLSGLQDGRPLHQLIKDLELKLDLKEINPGIVSYLGGKKIRRHKDQDEWIKELENSYPKVNHKKFWKLIQEIDHLGWSLSSSMKNIPLRSFRDFLDFTPKKIIDTVKLLPYLLKNVSSYIPQNTEQDYKTLINELLFITAQNNMGDTPMLMGAMGLNYPTDTHYAIGGMKAFTLALASKCSNIFYRHRVLSILPTKEGLDGFQIKTNKGDFKSLRIVSTLPFWNHSTLFLDKKLQLFFAEHDSEKLLNRCWSAFMIYLTIPLDITREEIYNQIHCDPIPNCQTKSFFVSISHPEDKTRSKSGRSVVTISTHTKPDQWIGLSKDEYELKKNETAEFILKKLCSELNLERASLNDILTGSPNTFIKFTRRTKGLVGGIPHSLTRPLWQMMQSTSPLKNFYLIGDTQFPGQGIAAVVSGAQNLIHQLGNK